MNATYSFPQPSEHPATTIQRDRVYGDGGRLCHFGGRHSWQSYPAPAGDFCRKCGMNQSTFLASR